MYIDVTLVPLDIEEEEKRDDLMVALSLCISLFFFTRWLIQLIQLTIATQTMSNFRRRSGARSVDT